MSMNRVVKKNGKLFLLRQRQAKVIRGRIAMSRRKRWTSQK